MSNDMDSLHPHVSDVDQPSNSDISVHHFLTSDQVAISVLDHFKCAWKHVALWHHTHSNVLCQMKVMDHAVDDG